MSLAKAANFAMLWRAQRQFYYRYEISTCEQGKQSQQALSLLCATWEAKLKPPAVDSTSGSTFAGISACGKGGQWQQALSLLRQMWEVKLVPDVISLSAGALACDGGGHGQQAIWMLTETRDVKLESFSDLLVIAMRT
ncbi:unnamed protein product [Prorocentrum cordatum]|uniref:Pentatricopeptide repeat-containing protein n=1 Tax=Prorocentrum cordatum TaxID=2364126 RepID=A0ABN9W993_9DINO|nr:unnamed protein product [Polarella glacialis]